MTFSALAVAAPLTVAAAAGTATHSAKRYAAKQQITKTVPSKGERSVRASTRQANQRHADQDTVRLRRVAGELMVEQRGKASYYADKFHGRRTATGELYDRDRLTAASNVLPMGSTATVINNHNGRSVDVTINDRGPHGGGGRVIDLSRRAAAELGMVSRGIAQVTIQAKPTQELARRLQVHEDERELALAP